MFCDECIGLISICLYREAWFFPTRKLILNVSKQSTNGDDNGNGDDSNFNLILDKKHVDHSDYEVVVEDYGDDDAVPAAGVVNGLNLFAVAEDCPPKWIMYDRCYFFAEDMKKFHAAQAVCMRMNASLIEIHDDNINTWVGNEVSKR